MHALSILKIFALSQGATFGALFGAVVSVGTLPFTKNYFPMALLVLTGVCATVGFIIAAVRLKGRRRHAHRETHA